MNLNEKPSIPNPGESAQTIIDFEEKIDDPRFDELEFFNAEIKPLVQKLIELCKPKQIPFVCGVNFANVEGKGTGICITALMPAARTPMAFRLFTEAMQDDSQTILSGMMLGAAMAHAADKNDKK